MRFGTESPQCLIGDLARRIHRFLRRGSAGSRPRHTVVLQSGV